MGKCSASPAFSSISCAWAELRLLFAKAIAVPCPVGKRVCHLKCSHNSLVTDWEPQQKAECAGDRTENEHLHPFRNAIPFRQSEQFELLWSPACTLETERCECVLLHPQFYSAGDPNCTPLCLAVGVDYFTLTVKTLKKKKGFSDDKFCVV